MIDSILDRAASILERRFLTNAFLPVVLLPLAVALPGLVGEGRLGRAIGGWAQASLGTKAFLIVGYFTLSWFFAVILASQWRNVVRLFEGYPLWRWPRLDNAGKQWHSAVSRYLGETVNRGHWYLEYSRYPPPRDVLPTRLGNVLRAAERYPQQRYGAEMILVWPRLYWVLPREALDDVEGARSTMEFLLVLSLWFCGFATGAPLVAIFLQDTPLAAIVCFVTGVCGAYAAYLSAIAAASEYGEQLRSIFDVYRLDLLLRMRIPPAQNIMDERKQWEALGALIGGRVLPDWTYSNGAANSGES